MLTRNNIREKHSYNNVNNLFDLEIMTMIVSCNIPNMLTYTTLNIRFKVFNQFDTIEYSVW